MTQLIGLEAIGKTYLPIYNQYFVLLAQSLRPTA